MSLTESGNVDLVKIAELLRIVARHCEEGNAELLRVTEELAEARARLDEFDSWATDLEIDVNSLSATFREQP